MKKRRSSKSATEKARLKKVALRKAALARAASAKKRKHTPRPGPKPRPRPRPQPKPRKKPRKKPRTPKKPKKDAAPSASIPKLTREQKKALEKLPPELQKAIAGTGTRNPAAEKRAKKELARAVEETKEIKTALGELKRGVRDAAKNTKRAYGYDPKLRKHHDVRGAFAGYKYKKFHKRAGHVKTVLRDKFPRDFERDLHTQAVHVREYMAQGDRSRGLRAIIEKVLATGRACIDEKLLNKKTQKPLRVYQIYIARIRILVRDKDLGKYLGYQTQPISGERSKAAADIRGLTGFETVGPRENPKVALDRIAERLEHHLVDILDGLPVIYVKSLEIKFDTEPQ